MGIVINAEEFAGIDPLQRQCEEAEEAARLIQRYFFSADQTEQQRIRCCQLGCRLKLLGDAIESQVRLRLGPTIKPSAPLLKSG